MSGPIPESGGNSNCFRLEENVHCENYQFYVSLELPLMDGKTVYQFMVSKNGIDFVADFELRKKLSEYSTIT